MKELKAKIEELAQIYSDKLKEQIEARTEEMKDDDTAHYLIYRVLGITIEEGQRIDIYQNTGRFLYKYAGSFLEEVATFCLNYKFSEGIKTKINNSRGQRPATFEIDFLNNKDAIEIKWRDATTDGDHITKEHTRIQTISDAGYKPIRVMFYYPQRKQAIRIQETLKTLYAGVGGEYYAGDEAWKYLKEYTSIDLKAILMEIANKRIPDVSNELTEAVSEITKKD